MLSEISQLGIIIIGCLRYDIFLTLITKFSQNVLTYYSSIVIVHYSTNVLASGGGSMHFNNDPNKPIYVQLFVWLEGEIMNGNLIEEERIYSQYQLAEMFNINPATAAKALNLLVDNGVIYKKRGMGMFVLDGAKQMVLEKRRDSTLKKMISDLVMESKSIGISEVELYEMIKQTFIQSKSSE